MPDHNYHGDRGRGGVTVGDRESRGVMGDRDGREKRIPHRDGGGANTSGR